MNRKSLNRSKGFTLIELLVVVLILGILVALALPAYLSSIKTARTNTAKANARAIASAIQSAYVKDGGQSYLNVISAAGVPGSAGGALISDMGGNVPTDPCLAAPHTADFQDYVTSASATGVTLQAAGGGSALCDATTPVVTLGTP